MQQDNIVLKSKMKVSDVEKTNENENDYKSEESEETKELYISKIINNSQKKYIQQLSPEEFDKHKLSELKFNDKYKQIQTKELSDSITYFEDDVKIRCEKYDDGDYTILVEGGISIGKYLLKGPRSRLNGKRGGKHIIYHPEDIQTIKYLRQILKPKYVTIYKNNEAIDVIEFNVSNLDKYLKKDSYCLKVNKYGEDGTLRIHNLVKKEKTKPIKIKESVIDESNVQENSVPDVDYRDLLSKQTSLLQSKTSECEKLYDECEKLRNEKKELKTELAI